MDDFDREALYLELSDKLDNIDELLDNSDVNESEDEEFAEIFDYIEKLRSIINKE